MMNYLRALLSQAFQEKTAEISTPVASRIPSAQEILADNTAYQVLHHLSVIAPYTSWNLAAAAMQITILVALIEEYYQANAENVEGMEEDDILKIKAAIAEIAKVTKLSVDLTLDENTNIATVRKQSTTVPMAKGMYLSWAQTALNNTEELVVLGLQARKAEKITTHRINWHKDGPNPNQEQIFTLQFEIYSRYYELTQKTGTGTCGELAYAGIYTLITQSDYQGKIFLIQGANVDHDFILINCDTLPAVGTAFSLKDLPVGALIIDPWLRCKFTADRAHEYYGDMNNFRHKPKVDKADELTFKVSMMISPEEIAFSRQKFAKENNVDPNARQSLSLQA